jgi:hypothetical protein
MIGMPERFLDLCCSLGPDLRRYWLFELARSVLREAVSCRIGVVQCGEDGGDNEGEENMANSDPAVFVETEGKCNVGGNEVVKDVAQRWWHLQEASVSSLAASHKLKKLVVFRPRSNEQ